MKKFILLLSAAFAMGCGGNSEEKKGEETTGNDAQKEAQKFLDDYTTKFQKLLVDVNEGQWTLQTHIVEGDTVSNAKAQKSDKAFADFTGSKENIDAAKKLMEKQAQLTDLQVRQLKYILYMAGNNPASAGDLVAKKIKATNDQTEKLFGFKFTFKGKPVTANDLDRILHESNNLNERLDAWVASKEVGKALKDGLANLQGLRNGVVKPLGYSDYFSYQVSEYEMSSEELLAECDKMITELWPLYRELHTWARYELASKYKQPVPDLLPAHWLPNRWGQDWTALVKVEGLDIDAELKKKEPEWIIQKAEDFYVGMGFDKLPKTFWEKSSLYPVKADAGYSKNNHASAWHIDNDHDVRSLMSVESNSEWWGTTLHEMGHIFYYLEYSKPEIPLILRSGTNRGYHEAFGTMIAMASMQKAFLEGQGLVKPGVKTDEMQILLKEALDYIVMVPWSAGVMTHYEYELYKNNLPKDQYNAKWWELVKKYQGIEPPMARGEEYCDAATKTHINDDPAQYYDYAIANVLLFQFHEHIATKILKQDVHNTNYWGSKEVGSFLKSIMAPGATVDWREHLNKVLGTGISAKSMLNYYMPLMDYLKEKNKGRKYTLPETL
ncbi:MAG TPA: M2 family metallopeptidase [Flavobacteriales bacterium]|nr:M2 family metallopeptidase [Flavobacteriales bacterium]